MSTTSKVELSDFQWDLCIQQTSVISSLNKGICLGLGGSVTLWYWPNALCHKFKLIPFLTQFCCLKNGDNNRMYLRQLVRGLEVILHVSTQSIYAIIFIIIPEMNETWYLLWRSSLWIMEYSFQLILALFEKYLLRIYWVQDTGEDTGIRMEKVLALPLKSADCGEWNET